MALLNLFRHSMSKATSQVIGSFLFLVLGEQWTVRLWDRGSEWSAGVRGGFDPRMTRPAKAEKQMSRIGEHWNGWPPNSRDTQILIECGDSVDESPQILRYCSDD